MVEALTKGLAKDLHAMLVSEQMVIHLPQESDTDNADWAQIAGAKIERRVRSSVSQYALKGKGKHENRKFKVTRLPDAVVVYRIG